MDEVYAVPEYVQHRVWQILYLSEVIIYTIDKQIFHFPVIKTIFNELLRVSRGTSECKTILKSSVELLSILVGQIVDIVHDLASIGVYGFKREDTEAFRLQNKKSILPVSG